MKIGGVIFEEKCESVKEGDSFWKGVEISYYLQSGANYAQAKAGMKQQQLETTLTATMADVMGVIAGVINTRGVDKDGDTCNKRLLRFKNSPFSLFV